MAQFLAPIINDQQENSNGAPLSGGTIEVYLAGTSTPSTTYSDKAGMVPNTWPIVLNTLGVNNQGAVWLTGGVSYKYVIKDSTGIDQRTIDNVSGINDNAAAADQWIVFQGTPTYVSPTSFTVPGDQTNIFQVGRRIRTTNTGGTIYSTVLASTYGAPNTTVTVANDSGTLDSGLSAVSYGLISVADSSLPGAFRMGQCRLVKSGANIVLQPYQGNQITINGATVRIPSGGVSLAPTGLTVSTLYYIYLALVAGVLTLEASTTGHSTDTTTGVEIKTGDPTRTLVGMARPITGPAWQDIADQRFVVSWFNPRPLILRAGGVSGGSVSATPAELNVVYRAQWLHWDGQQPWFALTGTASNNTQPNTVVSALRLDGATLINSQTLSEPLNGGALNISFVAPINSPTEGYHYVTLFVSVSGGTGTWNADCFTSGQVMG